MRLALLKRSRWKVLTYILLDLSYKFEFNQTNKKSKSSPKEKKWTVYLFKPNYFL